MGFVMSCRIFLSCVVFGGACTVTTLWTLLCYSYFSYHFNFYGLFETLHLLHIERISCILFIKSSLTLSLCLSFSLSIIYFISFSLHLCVSTLIRSFRYNMRLYVFDGNPSQSTST